ncbi:hypothetical protein [Streptomyces sp. SID4985]|uniref:hypothetical protein n=1 Tax=unclassified Streptomyces TaxID=2593676 RepID=UPI001367BD63|nr:hypothetical protein [Streptomyces sp. SID4985]MYQ43806.1 hypothetical protein [Streptomyces sp. SID4985]
MNDDARITALLHTLDRLPGPDHLEFPDGFDLARAKTRAIRLKDHLTRDFGHPCRLDDQNQDASYYCEVDVPGEATGAGVPLVLRLSNFGDLAAVTVPGPLGQESPEGAVAAEPLRMADTALRDLGYTPVPVRLLHRPYDGVSTWLAAEEPDRATWWTRFFDYL